MALTKRTFYPTPEVEEVLNKAAVKKVSEKVNLLILKGLAKEDEECTAREYERYDEVLAGCATENKKEVKRNLNLATALFDDEDEIRDWF